MRNSNKITVILALVSLFLFLMIMFNLSSFSRIDSFFNSFSTSIQIPWLVQMSKIISIIFEPINVIVFSIILSLFMWARKSRKDSVFFAILMIAGGIAMYSLKELVQRARPLNSLISESSFSFPSGHALITMIFFGFLMHLTIKNSKSKTNKAIISVILTILIVIIGASRIILNVHWFSDILGSWLIGLSLILGLVSIKQQ